MRRCFLWRVSMPKGACFCWEGGLFWEGERPLSGPGRPLLFHPRTKSVKPCNTRCSTDTEASRHVHREAGRLPTNSVGGRHIGWYTRLPTYPGGIPALPAPLGIPTLPAPGVYTRCDIPGWYIPGDIPGWCIAWLPTRVVYSLVTYPGGT